MISGRSSQDFERTDQIIDVVHVESRGEGLGQLSELVGD